MRVYNKLVRDNIPDIIRAAGETPITRTVSSEEYAQLLRSKLLEEVQEFLEAGDLEELADLYEVMLAILHQKNVSLAEFEQLRASKAREKGSFANRILLEAVAE